MFLFFRYENRVMQILNFYVLWDLYRVLPHIKDKHQGMNGGQGDHDSLYNLNPLDKWIFWLFYLLLTLWWFVIFGKYWSSCTNGSARHSKLLFENEMQGTKNIHSWLRYFQDGIKCYYPEEKILLLVIYMNTN